MYGISFEEEADYQNGEFYVNFYIGENKFTLVIPKSLFISEIKIYDDKYCRYQAYLVEEIKNEAGSKKLRIALTFEGVSNAITLSFYMHFYPQIYKELLGIKYEDSEIPECFKET